MNLSSENVNWEKNLLDEKACFKYLNVGHHSRKCKSRLKGSICGYSHVPLIYQNLPSKRKPSELTAKTEIVENIVSKERTLLSTLGWYIMEKYMLTYCLRNLE